MSSPAADPPPAAPAASTAAFWQTLLPDWPVAEATKPPFQASYPARLPDGRVLVLPLRPLPDGEHAVASLIANQASFAVVAALADAMARLAGAASPDIIVGLPTLGLTFAPLVAQQLGHARYV